MRKFFDCIKDYFILLVAGLVAAVVLSAFHYLSLYIFDYIELSIEPSFINIVTVVAFDCGLIVANGFLIHMINRTGVNIFVIEKRIRNREKIRVWLNVALTFLTCYISFALGLALGAENAMTILGGLIGYFFFRMTKIDRRKGFLIGASMGFSVALSNPLVGVAIYIEAYEKKAKFKNVLKVAFASLVAYSCYSLIVGSFHFGLYFEDVREYIKGVETSIFILIPLIVIFAGYIFSKGIFLIKKLFQNHIPEYVDFALALIISVALRFFYSRAIGTGESFFHSIGTFEPIISLLIYLLIRYGLIAYSFNSNFNGGMVIPTLAYGAALGKLMVLLTANFYDFNQNQATLIVIVITLCFYAFVSGSYLTSFFLAISFVDIRYIIVPLTFSLTVTYIINKRTIHFNGISKTILKMNAVHRYRVMPIFKIFDRPRQYENIDN